MDDTVAQLKARVQELERKENQLTREKLDLENDFSQKRAKFKELFVNKESELQLCKSDLNEESSRCGDLEMKVKNLTIELEDVRHLLQILEGSQQDEVETIRQSYQAEVASLQHIMTETVTDTEVENMRLAETKHKLEQEIEQLKKQAAQQRAGILSVAKALPRTLKKFRENLDAGGSISSAASAAVRDIKDEESLESSMEKKTRSQMISDPNKAVDELLGLTDTTAPLSSSLLDAPVPETPQILSSSSLLSRQEEGDAGDVAELRVILERERVEHNQLRHAWNLMNTQFVQSQRALAKEMERMQSLLTPEQLHQLQDLEKKHGVKEELDVLNKTVEDQGLNINVSDFVGSSSPQMTSLLSNVSLTSQVSVDTLLQVESSVPSPYLSFIRENSLEGKRSLSSGCIPDQITTKIQPPPSSTAERSSPTSSRVGHVRCSSEVPLVAVGSGMKVVGEREFSNLQREVTSLRHKLSSGCDMCQNYETQLQAAQKEAKKSIEGEKTLETVLEKYKQDLQREQSYRDDLEKSIKSMSDENEVKIKELYKKLEENEIEMMSMKREYSEWCRSCEDELRLLINMREETQAEITRLRRDNDELQALHSQYYMQLTHEEISIPQNMEEMQMLVLKTQDELIAAKTQADHLDQKLKSEIFFLKDAISAADLEKNNMEDSYTHEIESLREELVKLESVKSEMDRESRVRREMEMSLKESQVNLNKLQQRHKQMVEGLREQLKVTNADKTHLTEETMRMRNQVLSLQHDLENSEAVQRDFVKLSQSLQVELEKIRQSNTEVRWQHEDDVEECSFCKQAFTLSKRKHHCRHCGKIFCVDCVSKIVNSGPSHKPARVCDVCHTLLVQDSAPYFSSEPPATVH